MRQKGDTQEKQNTKETEDPKEKKEKEKMKGEMKNVRMDEIMKLLFSVSKPLLIRAINYFFNENYDENDDVPIKFNDKESVSDDLRLSIADLVLQVAKPPVYHFEFQLSKTTSDNKMVIRMFKYGVQQALNTKKELDTETTLYFPKQAVLYLEEGESPKDDLKLKLIFPITENGAQTVIYKVIVKRIWEIGKEEKMEKGLYFLLPLDLFRIRRKVEKTKTADDMEYKQLSNEIKTATIEIARAATELRDMGKIADEDHDKILTVTGYLFNYFAYRYANLKLQREVPKVLKSLYSIAKQEGIELGERKGIQKGIQESAKKLLENGMDVDFICRTLELPREMVEELQRERIN